MKPPPKRVIELTQEKLETVIGYFLSEEVELANGLMSRTCALCKHYFLCSRCIIIDKYSPCYNQNWWPKISTKTIETAIPKVLAIYGWLELWK